MNSIVLVASLTLASLSVRVLLRWLPPQTRPFLVPDRGRLMSGLLSRIPAQYAPPSDFDVLPGQAAQDLLLCEQLWWLPAHDPHRM